MKRTLQNVSWNSKPQDIIVRSVQTDELENVMKFLGQDIAPLGMGCWVIGGPFFAGKQPLGFANVDDEESTRAIHAALDAGIQLFDTAAVYGAGHSERLLGEALKDRPDALIATKLGTGIDEQSKQMLADQTDAADVMPAIDASLKRLQRERIDLMLLHLNDLQIDVATPVFQEMEKARQAGKLRSYGWSTDYPASMDAMAVMEGFVAVEHCMNVFIDVPSVQASVERNDLTALIRSPLAMGVLTGKYDAQSTLSSEDVRATNSEWRDYFHDGKVAPKYLKNIEAIKELLQTGGRTLTQGALGWLIARSSHNIPIPGARTVEQVKENAGAIEFGPLPVGVMDEIETLIQREPEGEPRKR